MIIDTNVVLREYLILQATLTDIVDEKIYCPRLPENPVGDISLLPALGFFTRGGSSTPYIPGIVTPSVQFDCWGSSPIIARQVYRALYDVLQGIQNQTVTVDGNDYMILSAEEEVHAQDLQDIDIPEYFRVLAMFSIMIRAE